MSPHIHTLLSDAADGGTTPPPAVDLAAIRSAGRRATWRRRGAVGGSAVGAAAIVTSVALLIGGGGPAGVPTADGGDEGARDAAMWTAQAAVLAPFIDAIQANGYDTEVDDEVAWGAADGLNGGGSAMTYALVVHDGAGTGLAAVTQFEGPSGRSLALGGAADDPSTVAPEASPYSTMSVAPPDDGSAIVIIGTDDCAIRPHTPTPISWSTCEPFHDTGGYTVWVATAADALGATLLDADGSGVSMTVTTFPADDDGRGLTQLPLSATELATAVEAAAAAPWGEPTGTSDDPAYQSDCEITFDAGDSTASPLPPDAPVSTVPCDEFIDANDPDGTGDGVSSGPGEGVDTTALAEALKLKGYELVSTASGGGGVAGEDASDPMGWVTELLDVADGAGSTGGAGLGIFDTATLLGQPDDEMSSPCAVAPYTGADVDWRLADDTSQPCTPATELEVGVPAVFVAADGSAIAVTVLRADGSVASIALSRSVGDGGAALADLPLTEDELADVVSATYALGSAD